MMCDNASSNNQMIETLGARLVEFLRPANRMCCFTHILNLVVKSIMHQFDVSGERSGGEESHKLHKLAGDFECEELDTQDDLDDSQQEQKQVDGPCDDNDKDWFDK